MEHSVPSGGMDAALVEVDTVLATAHFANVSVDVGEGKACSVEAVARTVDVTPAGTAGTGTK